MWQRHRVRRTTQARFVVETASTVSVDESANAVFTTVNRDFNSFSDGNVLVSALTTYSAICIQYLTSYISAVALQCIDDCPCQCLLYDLASDIACTSLFILNIYRHYSRVNELHDSVNVMDGT